VNQQLTVPHIHILGICGTFMAGVAQIAKQMGCKVTGVDEHVYPPMSDLLAEEGIEVTEGYIPEKLPKDAVLVIGNALSRGNPCVEYILSQRLAYTSGAQWLAENVLQNKKVLAISGTHGKTTTTSMLAWILEYAGLNPSFLIGGVARNFGISARYTDSEYFVIEADEYDSAFFDKRSKFILYRPTVLLINNLEFDHADIFDNLLDIQKQFHHVVRTVPANGKVIFPANDTAIQEVMAKGCWAPTEAFGDAKSAWQVKAQAADGSSFAIYHEGKSIGTTSWKLLGLHNVHNALAATLCALEAGVDVATSLAALAEFEPPSRRLELIGEVKGVKVYDDFAHHPTAIETTLAGLRAHIGNERIIAVLEPRSYTMRSGCHANTLAASLHAANVVFMQQPENSEWKVDQVITEVAKTRPAAATSTVDDLISLITKEAKPGDHILIMSNGGFGGIYSKLLSALAL
jgi:UDP-N-acetylmuramate: L-alanyl-gamma-D-glutamyl-meso-diaminopimelate ligase